MLKTSKKTLQIFLFIAIWLPPSTSLPSYQTVQLIPNSGRGWAFREPIGLASGPSGSIFVIDTFNNRVQNFTRDGRLIIQFGKEGTDEGEFHNPYGIVRNPKNHTLWVTDSGNQRLQLFTENGLFLKSIENEWIKPTGIGIGPLGDVYVADTLGGFIYHLSSDGNIIDSWGGLGTGPGRFDWPHGVAVSPSDGSVFVVDSANHRIQRFCPDGNFIDSWGKEGDGDAQLKYPEGIAITAAGIVFVTDRHNSRIQIFTEEGDFIATWKDTYFYTPAGIMLDNEGLVWISDANEHTVQSFTTYGERINFWGGPELPIGLNTPEGVATDLNGRIWVSDTLHHRIVAFEPDGRLFKTWDGGENSENALYRPSRIILDRNGNIVVSNTGANRVQIFSQDGVSLYSLGRFGSGPAQFSDPRGLCFDSESNLYVVDKGNKRIQIFDPSYEYIKSIEGSLENPEDVAVAIDGTIYVADSALNQVLRFNSTGGISEDSSWPANNLKRPHGLDIDGDGNIYVSELSGHRVVKLSSSATVLGVFGEEGSFTGQLMYPGDINVNSDGRLFVADSHNHRIQVFSSSQIGTEPEPFFNQKAIIVAGGGPYPGNDLWDATRLSAHQAYGALKNQGFSRNQVRYYSEDVGLDLDNNGLADDVLQPPSISLLEDSVTEWASDAEWLILYLVNHGNEGLFRMSSRETLSAAKLARILGQRTGKTLVVIDACRAESFSSHLEGDNRIVIASAGTNQPAYFIGDGAVSFSSAFWSAVQGGKTVKASYSEGLAFLEEAGLSQTPAWNSGFDGQGEDLVLGYGARLGNKPLLEFPQVQIDPANRRLRLQVETHQESSADDITRVWALLRPNSLAPPEPDTPIIDLPTVELARQPDGTFSGETDLPINSTPFSVAFYARSINGQTAGPLVDHPVNDDFPRPSAILVQGYAPEPADRKAIARRIQFARETLLSRGFAEDDLHLFSPSDGLILDRLSDQLFTITNSDPGEVYLYLVGDGRMTEFPISAEETLTPDHLAGLAASLESLVLIWDAPYEDMNLLSPFSGPNRTIIAGFRRGPLAGAPAFSDLFWTDIGRGFSIGAAFRRASAFAWESNSPRLDDSGDGQFNTPDDGATAESQYLGSGVRLAAGLSGEPPIFLHGQAAFQLPVEDLAMLDDETQYHAKIIPPDLFPGSPEPKSRETDQMPFPEDNGGLEIERLTDFGTYRTALIATSSDGRTIELRRDNLFQNIGLDVFEPDNNRFEAKPITVDAGAFQERSIYPEEDIDWIVFGAKVDDPIFLKIKALEGEGFIDLKVLMNQSEIQSFSFHLDSNGWTQKLDVPVTGKYFLQIEKQDGEGETTFGYGIRMDHQTAPFPGYLRGQVLDDAENAISNAWIEIKGGVGEVSATTVSSPSDGRFMIVHPPGTATLEVTAEGYNVYSASVEIPETGERSETIYLKKTAAVIPPPAPVPPTKAIIRGRLIDEEARSVGNAVILIESGLGSENIIEEFETTEAGRFRLELPAGRYQLTINAGGYKPHTEILQVIEGVQVLREITLSPLKPPFALEPPPEGKPDSDDLLGFVFGRITDEEGDIIGDASITIQSATSEGKETRGVSSTEYGRFQIFHEPGEAILTVTADGYATKSLIVSIPVAGIKAVDVALVPVDSNDKTGGSGSAVDDTAGGVPNQEDDLPNPSTEPISSAPPSLSPPTVPPENPVKDREEDSAPVSAPSIPRPPEPHAGEAGSGCFISTIAG